jgi:hypothetical protein
LLFLSHKKCLRFFSETEASLKHDKPDQGKRVCKPKRLSSISATASLPGGRRRY